MAKKRKKPTKKKSKTRVLTVRLPKPGLSVVTVDDFMRDPSLIWRRDR